LCRYLLRATGRQKSGSKMLLMVIYLTGDPEVS
jgi:hypothetical protein